MATRCCSPARELDLPCGEDDVSYSLLPGILNFFRTLTSLHSGIYQGKLQIFVNRARIDQVAAGKQIQRWSGEKMPQRGAVELENIPAQHGVAACGRDHEKSENRKKRRLSRSGGTHYGDHLPHFDSKADPLQHLDRSRAVVVCMGQPLDLDQTDIFHYVRRYAISTIAFLELPCGWPEVTDTSRLPPPGQRKEKGQAETGKKERIMRAAFQKITSYFHCSSAKNTPQQRGCEAEAHGLPPGIGPECPYPPPRLPS